jgi:hypothetical protein
LRTRTQAAAKPRIHHIVSQQIIRDLIISLPRATGDSMMDTRQGFLLLETTATTCIAAVVWIMPSLSYPV